MKKPANQIHVPDQENEAIRDLIRARTAAVCDQRQARNRLKGFLLRHGFRYTGKSSWNDAHKRYLSGLVMPQAAQPKVSEAMQKRQEHQSKEVRLIAWQARRDCTKGSSNWASAKRAWW